uniref:VOC domain-containing protein n=1 Tax=Minutocellus polymorphus TaxID=265543 RepID=A0A7S0AVP6_9STRA|mmetsp:Transcript_4625/g.7861  ORF Transcript_4625/g.7861 Transcript_4625/m.7861 type:complete len:205 (+) Transcript_4625:101-715(+)
MKPSLLVSTSTSFFAIISLSATNICCADAFSTSPPSSANMSPPFKLKRIDHVVIRCRNYKAMFDFYTHVLGCTIDRPADVNRFGGALTHLRAGDAMIDLLSYDESELTEEGRQAVMKMHGGGEGAHSDKALGEISCFEAGMSTMDHLCIRASPFDEEKIIEFMKQMGVDVIDSGNRYSSEGVGPSIYVKDPEGNVVELKGQPNS